MRRNLRLGVALLVILLPAGCAQMFTSKTQVNVETFPDGRCVATYSSDKQQQGLEASVCGGIVKVDQAGTLESVVAATIQTQGMILQLMQQLMAGSKTGALTGS